MLVLTQFSLTLILRSVSGGETQSETNMLNGSTPRRIRTIRHFYDRTWKNRLIPGDEDPTFEVTLNLNVQRRLCGNKSRHNI